MKSASWLAALGAVVLSSTSLAQPITWTGEDGDWNDPSHWDPRPPANDDDVMIVASTVTLTGATPQLSGLTLEAGAHLVFKEPVRRPVDDCVTRLNARFIKVCNGSVITHARNDYDVADYEADGEVAWKLDGRVWITCEDLKIEAGSKIDVSNLGWYQHSAGGGAPGPGAPGVRKTFYTAASHGGIGGYRHLETVNNTLARNPVAMPYDEVESPRLPGSSGCASSATATTLGSAGGGAVRIEASGEVKIDGEILANADFSKGSYYGASGGSVWISCETIAGSGRIAADGQRVDQTSSTHMRCGGGGRIALTYDVAAQNASATPVPTLSFSVNSPAYTNGTAVTLGWADVGTLYFTDDRFLPADGRFDGVSGSIRNGEIHCGAWTRWSPTALRVENTRIRLGVGGQAAVTVNGPVTVGFAGRLDIGGDHEFVESYTVSSGDAANLLTHLRWTDGPMPSLTAASLTIGNGGVLNCYPSSTNGLNAAERMTVSLTGDLTIDAGGTYSPYCHPTNGSVVKVSCANCTIASGAKVDVRGHGFIGYLEQGLGPGMGMALSGYGGAYGGFAPKNSSSTAMNYGCPYGEVEAPVYPGSAGSANYMTQDGTAGGGLAWIEATGAIVVDGDVDARSQNWNSGIQMGYGSGGGIYLKGASVTGTGKLQANSTCGGQGTMVRVGSGGRIAVVYDPAAERAAIAGGADHVLQFNAGTTPSENWVTMFGYVEFNYATRWAADIGTVYLSDGQLLTDEFGKTGLVSGELHLGDWSTWQPQRLVLNGCRVRFNPDGGLVDLPGDVVLTNHAGVGLGGGASSWTNSYYCARLFTKGLGPRMRIRGNLILADEPDNTKKAFEKTYLNLMAGLANPAIDGIGGELQVDGDLTVGSNCVVFCSSDAIRGGGVRIKAKNVYLDRFGEFNAYALGFDGITRSSADPINFVTAPGPGGGGGATDGRGGGYGGYGASRSHAKYDESTKTGLVYGDEQCPTNCGSGGGLNAAGGGLVWIEAAKTMRLAGTINANGQNGPGSLNGGGSGGGIYLRCQTWDPVLETLSVTANGGRGGDSASSSYRSEGGGGRVAIWRTNDTDPTEAASRTYVSAKKGSNVTTSTSGRWATDGTVFWKTFGTGLLLFVK